jgi:hypothetical protein
VAVVEATVIVMVEVPAPVIELGLKPTVTPVGWPDAVKVMAESNPPVTVLVMVEVPLLPCATERVAGEAESENPEAAPLTVTAVAAEGIPFVTTYNSLAPVPMVEGTSKLVDTTVDPVPTPTLKPCVLQ